MDAVYDKTYRYSIDYKNKSLDLTAKIYYNKVKHDMQDRWRNSSIPWTDGTKSTRGYMMRTYAKSHVKGFKIEKNFKVEFAKIKTGIDGFIRNWKADNELMSLDNKGMIPDVDIKNIGLFLKADKKIDKNIFSFGLRFDNTKSEADKNAFGTANKNLYSQYYDSYLYSKTDNYLSGFILSKHYFAKKSYIYAGFGHTVRVPDPEERYIALKRPMNKPDWVGNPNLKPVKNNEFDTGIKYKKANFIISANGFYSKLNDYIYITKITSKDGTKNAMSYKNIGATFYGGDFNIKALFPYYLTFDFGGAYQRGKKDNGTDKDIAEIPPLKLRTALSYDDLIKYVQIEMIHSFKQNKVDSTLKESETSSYTVFNFKAGYKTKNFFVGFGIDNIFDKFYYTHLSYLRNPFSSGMKTAEPGRFIYLTLSAKM